MIKMDIEQIIKQSKVTGLVPDRLKSIPFDDQLDILVILAEIISPHFEEVRVDGYYRIESVIGYVGDIRKLNDERILWRREFSEEIGRASCRERV